MVHEGLIVLAVLACVFFLFALIFMVKGVFDFSDRKDWLDKFEKAGYEVSDDYHEDIKVAGTKHWWQLAFFPYVQEWTIKKQGVTFKVYLDALGTADSRIKYFGVKFSMPKPISDALDLKVERRSLFSRLIGTNKGEYGPLNKDFSIKGSNIMLVKFLLNNSHNLKELIRATNYCTQLDVDKESRFRVDRFPQSLVLACNQILDLVNLFRKYILQVTDSSKYTIHEIMQEFDLENVDLVCIICYQHVALENMGVLNCCSSVGHLAHLKQWLENHNSCPYCRNSDVILLDPVISQSETVER